MFSVVSPAPDFSCSTRLFFSAPVIWWCVVTVQSFSNWYDGLKVDQYEPVTDIRQEQMLLQIAAEVKEKKNPKQQDTPLTADGWLTVRIISAASALTQNHKFQTFSDVERNAIIDESMMLLCNTKLFPASVHVIEMTPVLIIDQVVEWAQKYK